MFGRQHAKELLLGSGQAPHIQEKLLWSLTQPHITLPRGAQFLSKELTTPQISSHKSSVWCLTGWGKGPAKLLPKNSQITQQHHHSNPNSCRPRDWIGFAGSRAVSASISLTTRFRLPKQFNSKCNNMFILA